MNDKLPIYTEIALALNVHKWPRLRQVACTVATRQIFELHKYGRFPAGMKLLDKLCKRWKLGDYACAMQAHYPF
jgi:hypothetical protein